MGAPVLRFSLSSTGHCDITYIDYVIITCIRNGQETICGACHNDFSGEFIFIDYSSKDYIGDIQYFATPITIGGVIASKHSISSTTLFEMYPEKEKKKISGE